jgi:hypothetical protein
MAATGEINIRCGPNLALLPCNLILAYQGLEKENLDQKSPGLPGWGLVQQASPLFIGKRNLLYMKIANYKKKILASVETVFCTV